MPKGVYERSGELTSAEKRKARSRRHSAKNRDLLREKSKQYYADNKLLIAERRKRRYDDNPDVVLRQQKTYRTKHREAILRKNARQRAIRNNVPVGDVAAIAAWESRWRSKKTVVCHWCSKRTRTTNVHVDHVVPLSKGGSHAVENFCVACKTCNLSKQGTLPEDWNAGLSQPLLFV